jgi:transglycosylase-like protein with SLT domain
MSGRLSEGPAAIAEAAFRSNLREAVTVWRARLAAPGGVPRECAAIGSEAAELRKVAESRGWWALAQHLGNVENLSREAPTALLDAVSAVVRRLGPNEDPQPSLSPAAPRDVDLARSAAFGAQSIALPPLLTEPAPPRADPAPAPPLPATINPSPPPEVAPRHVPALGPEPLRVAAHSPPIPVPVAHSPAPPKLLVKDMLGLNAFGKKGGKDESPARESPPRDRGLLGLQKPLPIPQASAPPKAAFSPPSPQRRPEPDRGPSARVLWRPPLAKDRGAPKPSGIGAARARTSPTGVPRWFYALGGGVALLALATVLIVAMSGSSEKKLDAGPQSDAGSRPRTKTAETATAAPETQDLVPPEVHFGEESERLRAVIDAQSRLAATCRGETCRNPWTAFAREATDVHAGPITLEPAPAAEPLSAWLRKLKKPEDFPLVDQPLLKATFDYDAKHVVGHQQFQKTLRRCSAYADIIEGALLRYGAPTWLIAVVYQESQCDPTIKSPVGALGLWQFMPESARAYDLQVVEDELDERMNPVKSTDAGVRFLTDLHRKLGAWDLALAAYNAGPYGVATRIARVGGHAGFWDLVRSGLLPDETARYVPAIEAHALVLKNLAALDFTTEGQTEDATEIRVKAGTRLSLVARAANTSTNRIHELNLDFLKEVVPSTELTVRVPTSEAPRAQEFLDHPDANDKRDTCVPKNFDWGHADFEDSPYAKGCGRVGPQ